MKKIPSVLTVEGPFKIPTRYGNFTVILTPRGILSLDFPMRKSGMACTKRQSSSSRAASLLRSVIRGMKAYFSGNRKVFQKIPVDLTFCTLFQKKVLTALSRIPYGSTVTYGELARRAGYPKAARAVGRVMSKNRVPLILPCHRVTGSAGRIGGYSAGIAWKRKLLSLEGSGIRGPGKRRENF